MSWPAAAGGAGAVALGVFLTWLFPGGRCRRFSTSVLPVLVVTLIAFGLAAILRETGIL